MGSAYVAALMTELMAHPFRHPACLSPALRSGHRGLVSLVPPKPHLLCGGRGHSSLGLQAPVGSEPLHSPEGLCYCQSTAEVETREGGPSATQPISDSLGSVKPELSVPPHSEPTGFISLTGLDWRHVTALGCAKI